ncbi:hypothetical protein NDU88_001533 [Pleurodeles waltl]|uniref:Uncharacterized protein n=1 Tax=Pleurodeles waltl TaxID=8319 RepID=A0AAV7TIK4_PLEWA|nr:hypothetical protein NDU88_001533 [Pleurodeles waltl]
MQVSGNTALSGPPHGPLQWTLVQGVQGVLLLFPSPAAQRNPPLGAKLCPVEPRYKRSHSGILPGDRGQPSARGSRLGRQNPQAGLAPCHAALSTAAILRSGGRTVSSCQSA